MNLDKKSLLDLSDHELQDKRVLVRADLNVPLHEDGTVASDYRVRETLPTLRYLVERKARVFVVTHLGRPKGQPEDKYRVKPVVEALQRLMPDTKVHYATGTVAETVAEWREKLPPGEILLLENIRFEPGETRNDMDLARQLASFADIYVNDAFGAAHRAHASTEGVARFVPVKVAGLLMQKELSALSGILHSPDKPFTAIIGGSKVSTKLEVLQQLIRQVNNLVIGGGMVFTFLKAKGYEVGSSLVEDEHIQTALDLMKDAEAHDKVIVLPKDIVVADKFAADAEVQTVSCQHIPEGWMGLDLGPDTINRIAEVVKNSKTVFWNGPLGVFEFPAFAEATRSTASCIAKLTQQDMLTSVIGGGDTQAAIEQFGMNPADFTHVSTGGGATMELIEGKELPGIVALEDKVPSPV